MSGGHLATYLNDHLAGSEVALELLEHLQRLVPGAPARQFAAELQAEIAADRQELEALMARLQVAQSRTRKVAAWIGEKFTELKLFLDDRKKEERCACLRSGTPFRSALRESVFCGTR
jgi:hypothetical protein